MVTQEELEKMSPEEIAELQKKNCIFCKIIAGEIPSNKVYEDDKVLAVLDINPAKKGHIVIMPKEHYPILPLIPGDIFKHIFVISKLLTKAVKKATLSEGATIFIANGAVAGQQSPHFLFHLIPRDAGDGLNFEPPSQGKFLDEQKNIFEALRNNLTIMMQNHLKREGGEKIQGSEHRTQLSPEEAEIKRTQITKIIEENKEVRNLLATDIEGFKNLIKQNAELNNLFAGVDLKILSETVKKINESVLKEKPKAEVFLGNNPLEQKNKVFAYFEEKPKAKELLLNDLKTFKELLSKREDVQEIFKDVNLDKLAEKLKVKGDSNE